MADDIGVNVIGQMETHGESAGVCIRGRCRGALSRPVELEKPRMTGVVSRVTCGARVSDVTSEDGVKLADSRTIGVSGAKAWM